MRCPEKDRRERLAGQKTFNGIDFVEVLGPEQTELRVHFLNVEPDLRGRIEAVAITGGKTVPTVPTLPIDDSDWETDADGRPVLRLRVPRPGDYSTYTLTLTCA